MALRSFKPNNAGFQKLAVSRGMRDALKQIAERGKTIAEGLAQDFRITGEYADSFEVTDETVEWTGLYPGPRAAVNLTNTAPYAAGVEWGNAHDHKPHRVLARTADMLETEGKL